MNEATSPDIEKVASVALFNELQDKVAEYQRNSSVTSTQKEELSHKLQDLKTQTSTKPEIGIGSFELNNLEQEIDDLQVQDGAATQPAENLATPLTPEQKQSEKINQVLDMILERAIKNDPVAGEYLTAQPELKQTLKALGTELVTILLEMDAARNATPEEQPAPLTPANPPANQAEASPTAPIAPATEIPVRVAKKEANEAQGQPTALDRLRAYLPKRAQKAETPNSSEVKRTPQEAAVHKVLSDLYLGDYDYYITNVKKNSALFYFTKALKDYLSDPSNKKNDEAVLRDLQGNQKNPDFVEFTLETSAKQFDLDKEEVRKLVIAKLQTYNIP